MNSKPRKPPSFFKIIFSCLPEKYMVSKTMRIPPEFIKTCPGLRASNIYELKCDEKSWRVNMETQDDGCFFVHGWSKFFEEQNLELGDFLVFRLVKKSIFEVDVYGRDCCEKVATFAEDHDDEGVQSPVEEEIEVISITENTSKRQREEDSGGNPSKRRETGFSGGYNTEQSAAVTVRKPRRSIKEMYPENVYSSVEISLNHKNSKYQVPLPEKFVEEARLKQSENVVIKDAEGREFSVSIYSDKSAGKNYLSTGWKNVWVENKIQIGSTISLKSNHGKRDEIELQIVNEDSERARENHGKDDEIELQIINKDSVRAKVNPTNSKMISAHEGCSSVELELKKYYRHRITVPNKFARDSGLKWEKGTVIKDPTGEKWPVKIRYLKKAGRTRLTAGWNDVRKANGLDVGHAFFFKYNHGAGNEIELHIPSGQKKLT